MPSDGERRANTEVSRDWCGVTVDAVERELGGVAIYVNGAIGDVNPATNGGFEGVRSLGEAVAGAALWSLSSAEPVTASCACAQSRCRCR